MITSQKPTAPVASPNAKSNQPVAHAAAPGKATGATSGSGGPDATCSVHRLEESLQLVESLHLTNEQKQKISQLTVAQTARCTEDKKHHHETHEQILALLTPEQQQKLQAESDGPGHCQQGGHPEPEHAMHG